MTRAEKRVLKAAIEKARLQGAERAGEHFYAQLGRQLFSGGLLHKAMDADAAPQPAAPESAGEESLDDTSDPHIALMLAMIDYAIEEKEAGRDPAAGLAHLRQLFDDPDALAKILGEPPPVVHKSYWAMVEKATTIQPLTAGGNPSYISHTPGRGKKAGAESVDPSHPDHPFNQTVPADHQEGKPWKADNGRWYVVLNGHTQFAPEAMIPGNEEEGPTPAAKTEGAKIGKEAQRQARGEVHHEARDVRLRIMDGKMTGEDFTALAKNLQKYTVDQLRKYRAALNQELGGPQNAGFGGAKRGEKYKAARRKGNMVNALMDYIHERAATLGPSAPGGQTAAAAPAAPAAASAAAPAAGSVASPAAPQKSSPAPAPAPAPATAAAPASAAAKPGAGAKPTPVKRKPGPSRVVGGVTHHPLHVTNVLNAIKNGASKKDLARAIAVSRDAGPKQHLSNMAEVANQLGMKAPGGMHEAKHFHDDLEAARAANAPSVGAKSGESQMMQNKVRRLAAAQAKVATELKGTAAHTAALRDVSNAKADLAGQRYKELKKQGATHEDAVRGADEAVARALGASGPTPPATPKPAPAPAAAAPVTAPAGIGDGPAGAALPPPASMKAPAPTRPPLGGGQLAPPPSPTAKPAPAAGGPAPAKPMSDDTGSLLQAEESAASPTAKPTPAGSPALPSAQKPGDALVDKFHQDTEKSLRETGHVLPADRAANTQVAQAWDMVKARGWDQHPEAVDRFVAASREATAGGNHPLSWGGAINHHFADLHAADASQQASAAQTVTGSSSPPAVESPQPPLPTPPEVATAPGETPAASPGPAPTTKPSGRGRGRGRKASTAIPAPTAPAAEPTPAASTPTEPVAESSAPPPKRVTPAPGKKSPWLRDNPLPDIEPSKPTPRPEAGPAALPTPARRPGTPPPPTGPVGNAPLPPELHALASLAGDPDALHRHVSELMAGAKSPATGGPFLAAYDALNRAHAGDFGRDVQHAVHPVLYEHAGDRGEQFRRVGEALRKLGHGTDAAPATQPPVPPAEAVSPPVEGPAAEVSPPPAMDRERASQWLGTLPKDRMTEFAQALLPATTGGDATPPPWLPPEGQQVWDALVKTAKEGAAGGAAESTRRAAAEEAVAKTPEIPPEPKPVAEKPVTEKPEGGKKGAVAKETPKKVPPKKAAEKPKAAAPAEKKEAEKKEVPKKEVVKNEPPKKATEKPAKKPTAAMIEAKIENAGSVEEMEKIASEHAPPAKEVERVEGVKQKVRDEKAAKGERPTNAVGAAGEAQERLPIAPESDDDEPPPAVAGPSDAEVAASRSRRLTDEEVSAGPRRTAKKPANIPDTDASRAAAERLRAKREAAEAQVGGVAADEPKPEPAKPGEGSPESAAKEPHEMTRGEYIAQVAGEKPPYPASPKKPFAGRNPDGSAKPLSPEDAAAHRSATNSYRRQLKKYRDYVEASNKAFRDHRSAVDQAVASGKAVPPEVLAEHSGGGATDRLPGGNADAVSPAAFPPEKVAEGAKVEGEHTADPAVAAEIARDHLTEDPDYYAKLKQVEGGGKAGSAKTAAGPQRHVAHQRLKDAIDASEGLTDEHRARYHAAVDRVAKSMPQAAHDRVAKNMAKAHFHPTGQHVGQGAIASSLDMDDAAKKKAMEHMKGRKVGGAYTRSSRHLHVDGGLEGGASWEGRHGGEHFHEHAIYAHELGHAIDGPDHEISESPEWKEAFGDEIDHTVEDQDQGRLPKLTRYGGSRPSEGLAEFARLVYGSDVPHAQIEKEFPKATAVFKKHGLWPEKERTGPAAEMPEVFDKSVPLGKDGSHADTLLKQPQAKGGGKPVTPASGGPGKYDAYLETLAAPDTGPEEVAEAAEAIGGKKFAAAVAKIKGRKGQVDAIRKHLAGGGDVHRMAEDDDGGKGGGKSVAGKSAASVDDSHKELTALKDADYETFRAAYEAATKAGKSGPAADREAEKAADAEIDRVFADLKAKHSPTEIHELAKRIYGKIGRASDSPASADRSLKLIRSDLTAVRRLILSQRV